MISTGVINSPLGLQDYIEAKNIELTPNPETNKQFFEFAFQAIMNGMQREQAQQYAETLGALDVFGQPDFLSLPPDFQNYIQEMQDAASEAIGDRYNAPEGDPSLQDVQIAEAVMSVTGNLTFQPQHSAVDKQITNTIREFMARDNITAQEAANKALNQTTQLMMDPYEVTDVTDLSAAQSAVESFQDMSIEDMASMSDAEAADMDDDMGFGEDSDW